MPDIRYALRNGDKTSTGGELVATGRSAFHYDVTIGVEGDYATCPACKTGGPVMNDCSPNFDMDGSQILVSGARVHCQCETKPVVLPSQTSFSVEVNRCGWDTQTLTSVPYVEEADENHGVYDEQVRVVDEKTRQPLAGLPYYIEVSDGTTYYGLTDEDGRCERVRTVLAETLTVHVGEEAEKRMEGAA